ncbi:alcohol dehydrogenase [Cryptococcus neoformans Bt85]|nr:alcohol dehydrogenase [Cryptococcus neoformans var. grubii Bt85]
MSSSSIPTKMRALVVPEPGVDHYSLQEQDTPSPEGTKVLLHIKASGLCHTDSMVRDGSFGGNWPIIGGHEPAGEVVAVGDNAEEVSVGDRVVALLPKDPCGTCPDCIMGDWKYCKFIKFGGINADGFFSEYALVEAKFCVPIPDSMSFEQAAPLGCAGVTVYAGIKKAQLKPGDVIAISGVGSLGYLGVQFAKAIGLKVVAIDTRTEALELVRSLDNDHRPDLIIDASKSKAKDALNAINGLRPSGYHGWGGVDASVLTSPAISSYQYAADLTRDHGTLILLAQPTKVEFQYPTFLARDITLRGSLHGNEVDLKDTVELAHKCNIKSEVKTFTINQHREMLDAVESDTWKGKAVLVF